MDQRGRRDFFISYAAADRAWAEWIAWQLEMNGYSVIVQAWDFEPGDNFVLRMRSALEEADRTLALISAAYLASPYCTDEWTGAFLHDADGRNRLLQVRIEECDPPPLLRSQVYVDLVGLSREEAQERLLAGVRRGRRRPASEPPFPAVRRQAAAPRFPGQGPGITNLPPRNALFSGRAPLLRRLHRILTGRSVAAVVQATTVHGLGGVGKTQLALEYCHRYGAERDIVWWLAAELPIAIPGQLTALARRLGIPECGDQAELLAALWDVLRDRDRWLLVYDNAENRRDLEPYLPPGGNGHVLITSRTPVWGTATVRLDVLRRDESISFLRRRTRTEDKATLAAMAEALGDLPLALEQAAAYMDETGTRPADYLRLLREHAAELLALGEPTTTQQTVATTWQVALDRIRSEVPVAQDLLSLCAFLAPDGIPRTLLREHAGALPETLRGTVRHPLAYNEVVSVIHRYSLMTVTPDSLTVHRLVQNVVRSSLGTDARRLWATAALRLIDAAFPRGSSDVTMWPTCAPLLPHALAAVKHARDLGIEAETTAGLLNKVAVYLWARADLEQAKLLHRQALALDEARLGSDHPFVASSLNNLGLVLWDLGELSEARAAHERALAIRESRPDCDPLDVASSLNNLGAVLGDLGQLTSARTMHERALAIWEERLGPDHPAVALSLSNLGVVLADLGDRIAARAAHERALAIRETRFGDRRRDRRGMGGPGTAQPDLGELAGARGARERAPVAGREARRPEAGHRPAVPAQNRERGPVPAVSRAKAGEHLVVATSLDNLGVVLADLGELDRARAVLERALAIREAQLGGEHPDVAWSMNNLGTVLADLGLAEEARAMLERALQIRRARLGEDHHDTASSLVNLAGVYVDLGATATAVELFREALRIRESRLGADHAATKRSKEYIDELMSRDS